MPDNDSLFFRDIQRNIELLAGQDGGVVVHKGKRIGPGKSDADSMVQGTAVSQTDKEAKIQEKYEQSKLGGIKGDVSDEEIDGIVDKYVESLVDEIFKGIR